MSDLRNPLIVLMPTRGTITLETHDALNYNMDDIPNVRVTVDRKPIVEARNRLAAAAQKIVSNADAAAFAANDLQRIGARQHLALWIDDDAWWPPGSITTMLETMTADPSIDLLCAYFSQCRSNFPPEVSFATRQVGFVTAKSTETGETIEELDDIEGIEEGPVQTIDGCGFHFLLHRVSILRELGDNPFSSMNGMREDVSFTRRASNRGFRLACDVRVTVAHIDAGSGEAFIPNSPPMQVYGSELIHAHTSPVRKKLNSGQNGARDDPAR